MRITGGVLLNRKVICPPGIIRPSMDRMRESLFSILTSRMDLDGTRWLDLFAGSGIISLEAISHGAIHSDLIEKDGGKKPTVKKNLELTNNTDGKATLYIKDALKYIEGYNGEPYDVIYSDPPFPMKGKEEMLTLVGDNGSILKKNGYFIIHIPEEDVKLWADEYKGLKHCDLRHYGRSKLIFYKKQE